MRSAFPCKDCKDRKLGCHATCELYLEKLEERHEEAKYEKSKTRFYNTFRVNKVRK